jgi:hypothetical protein
VIIWPRSVDHRPEEHDDRANVMAECDSRGRRTEAPARALRLNYEQERDDRTTASPASKAKPNYGTEAPTNAVSKAFATLLKFVRAATDAPAWRSGIPSLAVGDRIPDHSSLALIG